MRTVETSHDACPDPVRGVDGPRCRGWTSEAGHWSATTTFMPRSVAASSAAVRLFHQVPEVVGALNPRRTVLAPGFWRPLRTAVDFVQVVA